MSLRILGLPAYIEELQKCSGNGYQGFIMKSKIQQLTVPVQKNVQRAMGSCTREEEASHIRQLLET
jgi:hypothetical protein